MPLFAAAAYFVATAAPGDRVGGQEGRPTVGEEEGEEEKAVAQTAAGSEKGQGAGGDAGQGEHDSKAPDRDKE